MNRDTLPPKTIEQQVRMLAEVLNTVGAFIYSKDRNGCYTYANQQVLDLFDKTLEEVVGYDDSHFFELSVSKQLRKNDQEVMQGAITVENEETNFVKSIGEMRTYHIVKKPLFDENGVVVGMCGVSNDITNEKKLQDKLKEKESLLNTVLDNVDAHIYMKDEHRTFKYVNKKVASLFDLPVSEIVGKKETEILPKEVAEHFYQSDKKVFDTGEKQTIEEVVEGEDGATYHYLSVKIPFNLDVNSKHLIGFSTDVTELYRLKEEFRKQANTDPLTGLYNRRYFTECAVREFKRAQRSKQPLSVVSIDIDHFKKVNDEYGHPVGDEVLVAVSKNLLPNLRSEDILARIGGEEFSIVLPDTDLQQAADIAERIRQQQDELHIEGHWEGKIKVKVSAGVATKRAEDENFDTLFSRADKALYSAKNNGRNQVYCYHD